KLARARKIVAQPAVYEDKPVACLAPESDALQPRLIEWRRRRIDREIAIDQRTQRREAPSLVLDGGAALGPYALGACRAPHGTPGLRARLQSRTHAGVALEISAAAWDFRGDVHRHAASRANSA